MALRGTAGERPGQDECVARVGTLRLAFVVRGQVVRRGAPRGRAAVAFHREGNVIDRCIQH